MIEFKRLFNSRFTTQLLKPLTLLLASGCAVQPAPPSLSPRYEQVLTAPATFSATAPEINTSAKPIT